MPWNAAGTIWYPEGQTLEGYIGSGVLSQNNTPAPNQPDLSTTRAVLGNIPDSGQPTPDQIAHANTLYGGATSPGGITPGQIITDPQGNQHTISGASPSNWQGSSQADFSLTIDGQPQSLDDLLLKGWKLTPSPTGSGFTSETGYSPDYHEGSESAADIAAKLLREQFAYWQKTFQPIEMAQMQELSFMNPGVLDKAVNAASGTARDFYRDTAPGIISRENAAMGMAQTPQQKQVSDRLVNLSEGAAVTGAANLARANVRQQDELILYGSTPNYATA